MNNSLSFRVKTRASSEEIFAALLHVSKWWGFEDLEGQSKALDDVFTITHPGAHYSKQVVTAYERAKRLIWSITESQMPWLSNPQEWTGTRLIFELSPGQLCFTHEGLTPDLECYSRVSEGWHEVIETNFLNYLERHKIRTRYSVSVDFKRTAAEVFKKICNAGKWWPEMMEGSAEALNDEFVFKSGDAHFSKNKVVEFILDQKVTWLTTASRRAQDDFNWNNTRFIFELTPDNDRCNLRFTYDGWVLESEEVRLAEICDYTIKQQLVQFVG